MIHLATSRIEMKGGVAAVLVLLDEIEVEIDIMSNGLFFSVQQTGGTI